MIIGLEGHSFTGKTVLLEALAVKRDAVSIAECDTYAGGIDKYPPFPPTNQQMSIDNVDFFGGLELKRVGDVELANDTNIFVDRTFLSVIIFQDFIKSLENGWSNAGDYARNYYKNKIEKGTVIIPDLMVLVTCNNQDEYISRQAREISVDELRALDAYSFYNLSYHKALGVYSRQDRLLIVDNSGDKELATVVDEILFFINVQDELRPDIKKKMALEMIDAL